MRIIKVVWTCQRRRKTLTDQFIQSRLEEMMPANTEDASKVKPTFQLQTMQSKLTTYFPRI